MTSFLNRPIAVVAVMFGTLIPVFGYSGYVVHSLVSSAFIQLDRVDTAQNITGSLLRQQLDQETGIRGYASTGYTEFLDPYYSATKTINPTFAHLNQTLNDAGLAALKPHIDTAERIEKQWSSTVALPLIARRPETLRDGHVATITLQLRGKKLVDAFRSEIRQVSLALRKERLITVERSRVAIDRIAVLMLIVFSGTALFGYIFLLIQNRMSKSLEESRRRNEDEQRRLMELRVALSTKKHIAETLQEAFLQRALPSMATMKLSALYAPANEEANVGGDWYEAIELPADRALIIIGDVSGHGIEAAVGMSRARQEFVNSALRTSDPAKILAYVNAALTRDGSPIVTALCGILDIKRFEFSYATAGHPPPILKEPGRPPRLLSFGGIPLGVQAETDYTTTTLQTIPGATLVLYTDGAIEHSRSIIDGENLLLEATAQHTDPEIPEPAHSIHHAIFAERHAADDVAILTMTFMNELQHQRLDSDEFGHNINLGRRNMLEKNSRPAFSRRSQEFRRKGTAPLNLRLSRPFARGSFSRERLHGA